MNQLIYTGIVNHCHADKVTKDEQRNKSRGENERNQNTMSRFKKETHEDTKEWDKWEKTTAKKKTDNWIGRNKSKHIG